MKHSNIVLVDYEATCAAGTGLEALREAVRTQTSGLRENDIAGSGLSTWIGKVAEVDKFEWQPHNAAWQSRNNAMIEVGLQQGSLLTSLDKLKNKFGAERIGVVMGSSTSSIDRAETAYQDFNEDERLKPEYQQEAVLNPHAPGLYVAERLDLRGPNITINTACSSSAKVFATASRWLQLDIVDAVLVGGADTLCLSVLHGFHSLQLVSEQQCRPFDQDRDGINLGEAAGFALLTLAENADEHCGVQLSGYGESSDAHHMSHPHPEGAGAKLAIEQALQAANLSTNEIGYINLHGTASKANDDIEGNLVGAMFGDATYASSTKGWTGHTLGAAGIIEAIFAIEALRFGTAPGTLNLSHVDEGINVQLSAENRQLDLEHVMTNSFGFGGNNACLIFSKVANA